MGQVALPRCPSLAAARPLVARILVIRVSGARGPDNRMGEARWGAVPKVVVMVVVVASGLGRSRESDGGDRQGGQSETRDHHVVAPLVNRGIANVDA